MCAFVSGRVVCVCVCVCLGGGSVDGLTKLAREEQYM